METFQTTERKFIALDQFERAAIKNIEGAYETRIIDAKTILVINEDRKILAEYLISKTKHKAATSNSSQIHGMGMGDAAYWNFTFKKVEGNK